MTQLFSTRHEDEWLRRSTDAAISQAKAVINDGSAINPRAAVGSLSELEIGWIVTAAIYGWIGCKAQQAVEEGGPAETAIRHLPGSPDPWDYGVVRTTLKDIVNIPFLDWNKPIGEWPQEHVVTLGWTFHKLIDAATAARDAAVGTITKKSAGVEARSINAAAGNGLLLPREMNDELPF